MLHYKVLRNCYSVKVWQNITIKTFGTLLQYKSLQNVTLKNFGTLLQYKFWHNVTLQTFGTLSQYKCLEHYYSTKIWRTDTM